MASYEKRNGKWSVRFRFGEKNHRLSGYPSKKSAEKAYLEYITSLRDNMTLYNDKIILKDSIKSISKDISTPTNLSFMELYNSYIKEISLSLKPHTIYNIQSCFRKHIIPYFKDIVNIQSIDKSLMDDWLASLTVSTTSKLKYRERFRTFLKWVNDNYDQSIPIQKMAAIRNDDVPKEMTIWTREQFNVFIATIQEPMMSALFNFLYYSGCRLSEALGLTYADIKDNKVYITKQRSHKGNSTKECPRGEPRS